MTEYHLTSCDKCSHPVDTDPNGDAHSDVILDEYENVTGELWWHPECCPDCNRTDTESIVTEVHRQAEKETVMTKYYVTVCRTQTFVIEAENIEEAHELCLDGELIDDEITDIFSTPEADRP